MKNLSSWLDGFLQSVNEVFAHRVVFVGLQGSYARKEATENSDLDLVVILDELKPEDIAAYDALLDRQAHRSKLCGFLSGKEELLHWESSDLFSFYHDTRPLQGSLEALLPLIDEEAVRRAVKIGACNLYHGCVHNLLYEKSTELLKGLYKSASFVIQAKLFLQTGRYFSTQKELMSRVSAEEKELLLTLADLKSNQPTEFLSASNALFVWAKALLK